MNNAQQLKVVALLEVLEVHQNITRQLTSQISALLAGSADELPAAVLEQQVPKKRTMSAAGRRAIGAATRARWAAKKAAEEREANRQKTAAATAARLKNVAARKKAKAAAKKAPAKKRTLKIMAA